MTGCPSDPPRVRLDSLPPWARFVAHSDGSSVMRGVVIGPGPQGGVLVELAMPGRGRAARQLERTEWAGSIMVVLAEAA